MSRRRILTTILPLVLVASACGSSASGDALAAARPASTPEAKTSDGAVGSPATTDLGDGGRPSNAVDSVLDELESAGFTGVVMVEQDGAVWSRGYGFADAGSGVENDSSTIFDVGSLTKQFTGAAILRLEMDGQLEVDDLLSAHLPGMAGDKADITIHQLLTHTAGFGESLGFDYQPIGRQEFIDLAADAPLDHAPGERYRYSNVGYSLLAAIIEIVTGGTYEEYLNAVLFEPAEMTSTGYVLPDWDVRNVAIGYDGDEALGRPNEQPWDVDGPYWHLRGNGGLLSSAEDMLRWHTALLDDSVLDDAAKQKYYDRHVLEGLGADSYYGYGWAIFPTPFDTWLVTHNGGNGIFFADILRFLDEGVTVFLASNAASAVVEDAAFSVAGAILGADLLGGEESGCGFEGVGLDDVTAFELLEDFPSDPAGATMAEWFMVLAGGDEAARVGFAADHVSELLSDGAPPEEVASVIAELQAELGDLSVDGIFRQDSVTFHVVMGELTGEPVLLSTGLEADDPERVRCLSINA